MNMMIYKMNAGEIKQLLHDFYATRYGKSIYVICYVVPFILFVVTMGMFFGFLVKHGEANYVLVVLPFLCMNTFCIGSYFYYKELKEFAESKSKDKKKTTLL